MYFIKPLLILIILLGFGVKHVYSRKLNNSEITIALNLHNFYRKHAGFFADVTASDMRKLEWDGELVKQADEWATCEHVTELSIPVPRQSIFHRYGANLLSRFRPRNTSDDVGSFIKTAVRGWFDEGRHFDVHSSACLPGHSCERYTQLVWARTHKMGCAVAENCQVPNDTSLFGTLLVCKYVIGGNIENVAPFTIGAVCTRCREEVPFCEDGLCVSSACRDDPDAHCYCALTCRKPGVGNGTLNREQCACNCHTGMGVNCDVECVNPDWDDNGFDTCAYWESIPGDCENFKNWHQRWCPANCHYGCRPADHFAETSVITIGSPKPTSLTTISNNVGNHDTDNSDDKETALAENERRKELLSGLLKLLRQTEQ